MNIETIISDADGVIINSQEVAWGKAHKIISLFYDVTPFKDLSEFKKHFGREAQISLVGSTESETIRSMHRLLMRHYAKEIACFNDVIEVYETILLKKMIVSSAYSSGIIEILGEKAKHFSAILGRESGRKIDILRKLYTGKEIYITDSVKDIEICKEVGMPVVGIGWGYDSSFKLLEKEPNYFADCPNDLKTIFLSLNS